MVRRFLRRTVILRHRRTQRLRTASFAGPHNEQKQADDYYDSPAIQRSARWLTWRGTVVDGALAAARQSPQACSDAPRCRHHFAGARSLHSRFARRLSSDVGKRRVRSLDSFGVTAPLGRHRRADVFRLPLQPGHRRYGTASLDRRRRRSRRRRSRKPQKAAKPTPTSSNRGHIPKPIPISAGLGHDP